MKKLYILLFLSLSLLVSCRQNMMRNPAQTMPRTMMTPNQQQNAFMNRIRVIAPPPNLGTVSRIDMTIQLPNSQQHILQYTGQAVIQGTMTVNNALCLPGPVNFRCNANFTVGTFNSMCNLNGQNANISGSLMRGQQANTSVSLLTFEVFFLQGCINPGMMNPGMNPGMNPIVRPPM